jgi:serine/threonine protein kinase/tetratricopeptide (TPR) repeat protein
MTDDRLSDVLRISRDALEREPEARAAYLDSACRADAALRRDVEALLADPSAGSRGLLDTPPWAPPSLDPGQRLGPYEVAGLLGAGGMGAVYKAQDTRLKRTVALKVLSGGSALDSTARERLTREAHAIAALDHPHICALYDIGTEGRTDYLVMEYLEGETLAKRLAPRGGAAHAKPLPLDEALIIGVQIADALAAAHKQGIVHRDLKPGNVMLTTTGAVRPGAPQVKLLDFGLAKLKHPGLGSALGESALSTAEPMTTPGAVMGTVPYMAPEQLEGKDVDARADLFSFGCVLYEMLTGRRAFPGETSASVISAIMTAQPPSISTLVPVTPPALEHLVTRCLAKNPDERWQTARDVADELRWLQETGGSVAESGASATAPAARRPRVAWWKIALPVAAVLASAASAYVLYERSRPVLTDRDVIVLADFVNTTGDAVFDGALKQALAMALEQSPFLSVYPADGVRDALKRMARPPDAPVTGALAREVCQREGLKAVLQGSVAALGNRYLIIVEAHDCDTGAALASDKEEAARKEEVVRALDRLAPRLRHRLGEALASVQKHDVPIEGKASTSSLEAYNAFSLAVKKLSVNKPAEAVPLFKRAIELDPNFAYAHARLAAAYESLPNSLAAQDESIQKAYALRDRVTEFERYYITVLYYAYHDGNLLKAIEAAESWKAAYPRSWLAAYNLGSAYTKVGRQQDAYEQARAVAFAPGMGPGAVSGVIQAAINTNRLAEAKTLCARLAEKFPDYGLVHHWLYRIAHLENDEAAMRAQREWARGKPEEPQFVNAERLRASEYGQFALSRKIASERAAAAGQKPPTGSGIGPSTQVFVGNLDVVRKEARAVLATNKDNWLAAFALSLAGETAPAEALASDLEARYPVDTIVQKQMVPVLRASAELARNHPQRAIELLAPARPYDGREYYSPYLRGLAYLRTASAAEAAAEFQRIIDRRGVDEFSVLWPLSHLGKARALALGGDVAASKKAYEVFLTLWKDADPDIPILREAKAEYAKLK